jgi:hypothetical protein
LSSGDQQSACHSNRHRQPAGRLKPSITFAFYLRARREYTSNLEGVAMSPAILSASDYGPMVRYAVVIIGATLAGAIVLGFVTAGLLVWYYRRRVLWLAGFPLAIAWGVIVFYVLRWIAGA